MNSNFESCEMQFNNCLYLRALKNAIANIPVAIFIVQTYFQLTINKCKAIWFCCVKDEPEERWSDSGNSIQASLLLYQVYKIIITSYLGFIL